MLINMKFKVLNKKKDRLSTKNPKRIAGILFSFFFFKFSASIFIFWAFVCVFQLFSTCQPKYLFPFNISLFM